MTVKPDEPDFEPIKREALRAFAYPLTSSSSRRPWWAPREDTGLRELPDLLPTKADPALVNVTERGRPPTPQFPKKPGYEYGERGVLPRHARVTLHVFGLIALLLYLFSCGVVGWYLSEGIARWVAG